MATSNISNTILDLSGSAVSDVVVVARLKPGPGFRIYEGTEVASQVTTTSASNGAWTLTLEQNEPASPAVATKLGISPSGSYYEIEEQIPDAKGGLKSWTVTVGTVSQTLYAALVTTLPADVGPTYLTQSSGDARYSQLGNIGSTSTTAVAATASQGTASSAARSDHIHNLGSIVDSSTVELSSGLIRVKDSGITTAKIADSGVTTAKINNGAVTTLKTNFSFDTTAARDAAITAPVAGMICYINSGDSSEGLYSYSGGAWYKGPGWNAPWGMLGKVTSTSSSSTTGTHTTQQDGTVPLTVTLTTVTNRNYLVTSQHLSQNTSSRHRFAHVIGGTTKYSFQQIVNTGGEAQTVTGNYVFTETSGASKIFKVQMSSGTNVVSTDIALADYDRLLLIQDIGPSGAPA